MKRIMYIVSLFILIIGCKDKKDINSKTTQLSDSLSLYFIKADDGALSRTERIASIRKASAIILKQKQDSSSIDNLFRVANQYYNIDEIEASKKITLLIAQKAYKINDSVTIAKAEEYLGDCYKKQSLSDSAYLAYSKAENIYILLKDKESLGQIYLNKTLLYYNEGDFLRSQISAFKALNFFKEKNKRELYETYNLLGVTFNELQNYDSAVSYHNKALNTIKDVLIDNKVFYLASSLNNLGVVYRNKNKNKEAISHYREALQDKGLHKNSPSLYAMLLDNLAYSQLQLKDYSQLPDLFYKALSIRDSLQNIQGLIVNNKHLSEYYQDQKDNTKAIQYAQEAYTLAKEKDIDPRNILLSLEQLRKVDPSKEVIYLSEYVKISDSLKLIEPLLPNKLVQAEYENEELIFEKAQLEKDRKNLIIWSISIVSLLIIALLINYVRTKKKESRLKIQETQQKANDEIYELLSEQQTKIEDGRQIEKDRIAQELHDGIINKLVGTRIILESLNDRSDSEARKQAVTYIYTIQDIAKEIRSISHDLQNVSDKSNFETLLRNELKEQKEILSKTEIQISIDPVIEWDNIRNDIKMNLYRIIQESFQNIYKYAQAKKVIINIFEEKNYLNLHIIDDGVGYNMKQEQKGIGLKNMRSRVEIIKGTIKMISALGKGTSIEVTVPL